MEGVALKEQECVERGRSSSPIKQKMRRLDRYTQEEVALAQQTGGMNWNRAKTQKNKTEQKMKEWKAES